MDALSTVFGFFVYQSGTSSGFGMTLDLMVYIFIGCVIYIFLLIDEGGHFMMILILI